jgi:hypothetical protein
MTHAPKTSFHRALDFLNNATSAIEPRVLQPYWFFNVTVQPTVLQRPGGVCLQRIWAKQMSTFGNNLIERLTTALVHVRPQNQLGEGSIALAKNLNINGNAKTGRTDEQNVRYV